MLKNRYAQSNIRNVSGILRNRFIKPPNRQNSSKTVENNSASILLQKAGIYSGIVTGTVALLCGFYTCNLQIQSNVLANNDSSQRAQIDTLTSIVKEIRFQNELGKEQNRRTAELALLYEHQLTNYKRQLAVVEKQLEISQLEQEAVVNTTATQYNKDVFDLSKSMTHLQDLYFNYKMAKSLIRSGWPGPRYDDYPKTVGIRDSMGRLTEKTRETYNPFNGRDLNSEERRMFYFAYKRAALEAFLQKVDSLIKSPSISESHVLLPTSTIFLFQDLQNLIKNLRSSSISPRWRKIQDFHEGEIHASFEAFVNDKDLTGSGAKLLLVEKQIELIIKTCSKIFAKGIKTATY